MTNRQIERKLRQAMDRAAPDDIETVLASCSRREEKSGARPRKKKSRALKAFVSCAAAACLLLGLTGVFIAVGQFRAVASVISLDVNPSIQMSVNRQEMVLSCFALNDDAVPILSDMDGGRDLEGTKLDVAVNAVVGSLLRSGYLNRSSSALLVSVSDKDPDRADRLREELTASVDQALQAQSSQAAVLSQSIAPDPELTAQAESSHISAGKAVLVNQVVDINHSLRFDSLAPLSVEELQGLAASGAPGMPIGREAAAQAVRDYVGSIADQFRIEVDSELNKGTGYYEVELESPVYGEFDYLVDAYTGQVLRGVQDIASAQPGTGDRYDDDWDDWTDPGTAGTLIGREAAAQAVRDYVGSAAGQFRLEVDSETENGSRYYEVELKSPVYGEFNYLVDAYTGQVLRGVQDITSAQPGAGGRDDDDWDDRYDDDHDDWDDRYDDDDDDDWDDWDDRRPERPATGTGASAAPGTTPGSGTSAAPGPGRWDDDWDNDDWDDDDDDWDDDDWDDDDDDWDDD